MTSAKEIAPAAVKEDEALVDDLCEQIRLDTSARAIFSRVSTILAGVEESEDDFREVLAESGTKTLPSLEEGSQEKQEAKCSGCRSRNSERCPRCR